MSFSAFWLRSRIWLTAAASLAILMFLVYWGGTIQQGPLVFVGLAVLLAVIAFFAFLTYWFYLSPLPPRRAVQAVPGSPLVRQAIAIGVTIMGFLFVIGGFWDEVWHRTYGVGPTIDDFWWRPHILIYVSIAINALLALSGMAVIMLRGRGDLRQRFRAEPLLGLITLAGGFQILTTPLDPLWHAVYGLDITAWSLPHLLVGAGLTVVILAAIAVQLSLVPPAEWRLWGGWRLADVVIVLLLTGATLVISQIATTEFEGINSASQDGINAAVMARPEWLYPVVAITVSAFMGMIALYSTRRIGSASAVMLCALAARLILIRIFNAQDVGAQPLSHTLFLAPTLALDLWHAYRLRRGLDHPATPAVAGAWAALAMLLLGLPILAASTAYPRLIPPVIFGVAVFGLLMGIAAAWAGARVGAALRLHAMRAHEAAVAPPRWLFAGGAAGLLATLALVAVFIATAAPPII